MFTSSRSGTLAIFLLLSVADRGECGNIAPITIQIGSENYHLYHLKIDRPIREGEYYFEPYIVETYYRGNWKIPRLNVVPDGIKEVRFKWKFINGLCGAGPTGYNLEQTMTWVSPPPVTYSNSSMYDQSINGGRNLSGLVISFGDLGFTSKDPAHFSVQSGDGSDLILDLDTKLRAVGREDTYEVNTYARRYAGCAHVFPILEVTYTFQPWVEAVDRPPTFPTSQPMGAFGESVTEPDGKLPAELTVFPGELTGGAISSSVVHSSPKKFRIDFNGLRGFAYDLKSSDNLKKFDLIRSVDGADAPLSFEVDDESSPVTQRFYRIETRKLSIANFDSP